MKVDLNNYYLWRNIPKNTNFSINTNIFGEMYLKNNDFSKDNFSMKPKKEP